MNIPRHLTRVLSAFKSTEYCRHDPVLQKVRYSSVPFTTNRYPNLQRKPFAQVNEHDLDKFKSFVGESNVLTSDLDGYNTDWLGTVRGQSEVVLRPRSVSEVSSVLSYCNTRQIAVCPQGGNTGLVGGSVPVFDEIVLSTSNLNEVINIDEEAGVLQCGAGCVLEQLDSELAQHGLMMPLDLGAKGSCQIGGNISTNAGGIRLLRYGSLHGNVLGLQVVLANGEVLDSLNPLIKDNTGYDLKQLFIGSEGTLGIVTAASIKCPTKPNSVHGAMIAVDSFENCLRIFQHSRLAVGDILSAFEFMDLGSREVVRDNLDIDYPLGESPFYLLIETSGSNSTHDLEKLEYLLESLMTLGLVTDGTIAQDTTQLHYMWSLRERIAEALKADGYCYKYDISLPYNVWYDIVEDFRERLRGTNALRCVGYGHLGDGNLHLNMTSAEYDQAIMDRIEPYVYDWTAKQRGSISAEHGLGFKKAQYIYHSKSRELVDVMRSIKSLLDPKGILNPYKYLPDH